MRAGTLLPAPKPIGDFGLTDQDGKPYTLAALRGHWTFVAIGYTSCPDVCPTTMATFSAIVRKLGEGQGRHPTPRFLLISVDPERDGPERLAQYVRYFNPAFLGATGPHEQLKALTAQLGAMYARVQDEGSAMSYLVDHSATIFLLDPQARLVAVFSAPQDPLAMAADFATIARHTKS
jgi:protein SCO1/2